jgi:RNA polymerase sigma factor (sigma-70 family)
MDEDRHERFRSLYLGARHQVLAYALRRTQNVEDAADVAAETFAIAWRRLDDVPDGADALPWLYVTARNALANEARRAKRRSNLIARIGSVLAEHETVVAPPDEAALVAVTALRALAGEDRAVLMLAAWEGLDSADIGRTLGCSENAARVRLHRARKRLREQIAGFSGEGRAEKRPSSAGHTEEDGAPIGSVQGEV